MNKQLQIALAQAFEAGTPWKSALSAHANRNHIRACADNQQRMIETALKKHTAIGRRNWWQLINEMRSHVYEIDSRDNGDFNKRAKVVCDALDKKYARAEKWSLNEEAKLSRVAEAVLV